MVAFGDELKDAIFLLRAQKVHLKNVGSSSARTFFSFRECVLVKVQFSLELIL